MQNLFNILKIMTKISLYIYKSAQDYKRTEKIQNERKLLVAQNPTGRRQADKITQLHAHVTFTKKANMTKRVNQEQSEHSQGPPGHK